MKYLLILLILLSSCSLEKRVMNNETKVREWLHAPDTIKTTDTQLVQIESFVSDSMTLRALFACSDSNVILMENIELLKSKGVKTEFIFKNNTLYIKSKFDSVAWIKTYTTNHSKEKIVTIERDKQSTLDRLTREKTLKGFWFKVAAILFVLLSLGIFLKIKRII